MVTSQEKNIVYVIAKANWKTEKVYHNGQEKRENDDPFYASNDRSYHTPYEVVKVFKCKEDAKRVLAESYPKEFISKHIQTISSGPSGSWKETNEFIAYTVFPKECELKHDSIKNKKYTYIDKKCFVVVPENSTDDTNPDCLPY